MRIKSLKINKISSIYIFIALAVSFSSCHFGKKSRLDVDVSVCEPQTLVLHRYDKALFSLDTVNFGEGLKSLQDEFRPFLDADLDNPDIVKFFRDFVTDTFVEQVNGMVAARFDDVSWLNDEIKSVYKHFNYYFPQENIPDTYLYVSGLDLGSAPVMMMYGSVLVSLDFYLGANDSIYDMVGLPRYVSMRFTPSHIRRDVAEVLANKVFQYNSVYKDLLTEMVNSGKKMYIIKAMCPEMPDSIVLRYKASQMDWISDYERDVWAAVVGNDILYSNNGDVRRKFFADGPFTQAFSDEAPARLGEFFGFQIVRSYMENNDVTLSELLLDKDNYAIFQKSKYKPR